METRLTDVRSLLYGMTPFIYCITEKHVLQASWLLVKLAFFLEDGQEGNEGEERGEDDEDTEVSSSMVYTHV